MTRPAPSPAELVALLGLHPASALGLAPDLEADLGRWLVAACLLSSQRDEAAALRILGDLEASGLAEPRALASASPTGLAARLASARAARPDRLAGLLVRAGAGLEREGGSLAALAAGCDGLESLAARLASLAPGLGRSTVSRFLQPLRDAWPAAAELPLDPAARAAAVDLGWLRPGEDEDGEPGALRARLRREAPQPALADVEAALSRLGRRACLRARRDRCPLLADCPALRTEPAPI